MNPEQTRLAAHYEDKENWLFWGPYMSERQWGTVREDYSQDGNAWSYISHERSRGMPIAGVKTDLPDLVMRSNDYVFPWRCGIKKTRF